MFKVVTDYPIAFDSPDHLYPHGTKRDNFTDVHFILQFIEWYKSIYIAGIPAIRYTDPLTIMDVGCSGGALVKDWLKYTPYAVGLEGSDYSVKHERAEWPDLYNKNLFTCDISREFQVYYDDIPYECDLITAWEVIEHIPPDRLDIFFKNIWKHLKEGGVFLGSGCAASDKTGGVELHLSAFPKEKWEREIIPKDKFNIIAYPLIAVVRIADFYFCTIKSSKKYSHD